VHAQSFGLRWAGAMQCAFRTAGASTLRKEHDLERRINETAPRTAVDAAVKLRHLLRVLDDDSNLADDETTFSRQLLAYVESMVPAPQ
jgi:hypothetical protein